MKLAFFTIIASMYSTLALALSANEIVQKADLRRGIGEVSHSFDVEIQNSNGKSEKHHVLYKNVDMTLIEQIAPEKAKGRKLLMNGYDMWLFTKNIKKPVRISLDQKMTGEVSNGDIARTNYAQDYEAKIISENKDEYVLDLAAKNNKVTYAKIEYKIAKKTFYPLEATFFAVSGKPLKMANFSEYKNIDGQQRATRMTITDYIVKNKTSIIDFSNHKKETFKESIFNKDRLDF